ncbi:hypothetical protein COCNU_04G005970 [Cocos nucifera]|uniref:NAC domain-containing protein n=1 Tax=Cocos nucifera TaxID=13894 RepID=A0A8K0I5M0_COCNU|nr:hypothetical protein COCNU_04G005970 [Cocos nucifera]
MAGKKEEADHVSSYSNWKNLVMSNHFLRLLGVPLTAGSVAFEEVDVYMHHPAELFGSEPAWKHKFFFTNRLRNQPRADRARAKARGGYWLRTGKRELVKEIDGTPIGSKEQLVFNEGMYVKDSKKTNWYMNEYMMFEEQPLKSDDLEDDNKKKAAWILCELFQRNIAVDQEGGQHNSEYLDDQTGSLHPSSKKKRSVDMEEQSSARSGEWKEKRVEDYTSKDHDDFLAFMEECINNPPDWEYWGL